MNEKKKGQATHIAPLQPHTLAAFPPWGILQELVVWNLPGANIQSFNFLTIVLLCNFN